MKKTLSLLLAVIMVFSLLPLTVFAEGTPTISFETTFVEGMKAGDTFTVTGILANNPGMITMTLSLKWNDKAVRFTGFDVYDDGYPVSEVFEARGWNAEVNNELGIIVAARTTNNSDNGTLFTANFEVVGGGDLGIGLKNGGATEFQMANADRENIAPTIDYSAIENLTAAGNAVVEIPEGAPFTAITTDAGPIVAVAYVEDVEFNYGKVPYYIVTIPADAETVYVTAPDQVVMEDWTTGAMQATGYAANLEDMSALYISYNYEETDDGVKVEVPMNMVASDWSGEVELDFINTHAFGIEDANYACLGLIAFQYAEAEPCEHQYDGDCDTTCNLCQETREALAEHTAAENTDCTKNTVCSACEAVITEAKAAHNYEGAQWEKNAEGHWQKCQNAGCSATNTLQGHDYGNDDTCDICSWQRDHVHNMSEVAANEAKCGVAGNIAYYTCSGCENLYADVNGATQITLEDTVIEALKHEYTTYTPNNNAKCNANATETAECENGCGESHEREIPNSKVGHSYNAEGSCQWCGAAKPEGYTYATSEDVEMTTETEATVYVKVTAGDETAYNSYDFVVNYDPAKLTYKSLRLIDGDQAQAEVDAENGAIHIVGVGDAKSFETAMAAITFTVNKGQAEVTVSDAYISTEEQAKTADALPATANGGSDATANTTVISKHYSVTKPDYIEGAATVKPGADYKFKFTDTDNYTYTELTVNGQSFTGQADADGWYTVENVQGDLEIIAEQKAKEYELIQPDNATVTPVNGAKPTYGEDFVFTVEAKDSNSNVGNVYVTIGDGEKTELISNTDGEYTIEGSKITGNITVEVALSAAETIIKFITAEGSAPVSMGEVGALSVDWNAGQAYTFALIPEACYKYTFKVGETTLTVGENNTYIVPAELVVAGEVQIEVNKVVDKDQFEIAVSEYITGDEQSMWLITAKAADHKMTYGENTMFWSEKYDAYCWLVVSAEDQEAVKAAAKEALNLAAAEAEVVSVKYDCDVNLTSGKVDINDAQLAYDMYNAKYMVIDDIGMQKFLEADMTADAKLGTQDVAAIINKILN